MNDVQRCVSGLISHGARKGPEIIRFNAQLRGLWTPDGVLPMRPRAANDLSAPSMPTASPDPA